MSHSNHDTTPIRTMVSSVLGFFGGAAIGFITAFAFKILCPGLPEWIIWLVAFAGGVTEASVYIESIEHTLQTFFHVEGINDSLDYFLENKHQTEEQKKQGRFWIWMIMVVSAITGIMFFAITTTDASDILCQLLLTTLNVGQPPEMILWTSLIIAFLAGLAYLCQTFNTLREWVQDMYGRERKPFFKIIYEFFKKHCWFSQPNRNWKDYLGVFFNNLLILSMIFVGVFATISTSGTFWDSASSFFNWVLSSNFSISSTSAQVFSAILVFVFFLPSQIAFNVQNSVNSGLQYISQPIKRFFNPKQRAKDWKKCIAEIRKDYGRGLWHFLNPFRALNILLYYGIRLALLTVHAAATGIIAALGSDIFKGIPTTVARIFGFGCNFWSEFWSDLDFVLGRTSHGGHQHSETVPWIVLLIPFLLTKNLERLWEWAGASSYVDWKAIQNKIPLWPPSSSDLDEDESDQSDDELYRLDQSHSESHQQPLLANTHMSKTNIAADSTHSLHSHSQSDIHEHIACFIC